MVSSTVNVFRYSALITGVFYGVVHRRSLQTAHDQERERHAIHHRTELVAQAKEAWHQRQQKADDDVVTDPEDPRFDLEKLAAKWEKESS